MTTNGSALYRRMKRWNVVQHGIAPGVLEGAAGRGVHLGREVVCQKQDVHKNMGQGSSLGGCPTEMQGAAAVHQLHGQAHIGLNIAKAGVPGAGFQPSFAVV